MVRRLFTKQGQLTLALSGIACSCSEVPSAEPTAPSMVKVAVVSAQQEPRTLEGIVAVRLRNPSLDTVFVGRCERFLDATLQRQTTSGWITPKGQFCAYVAMPPIILRPSADTTLTLPLPLGDDNAPRAIYRYQVAMYSTWNGLTPSKEHLLPLELRTSNPFSLP